MTMIKNNTLDIMKEKHISALEFYYENLCTVPMQQIFDWAKIEKLNNIATSVKYSGDIKKKYDAINEVLYPLGFRKFCNGTNRMVFRHIELPELIAKCAIDNVGIRDNPAEYIGQKYIAPFNTKVFEVSPDGTLGFFERVSPIRSIFEYSNVADDIYDIILNKFIGTIIISDFGTKYFMNWGIRNGFGPVILDFPYIYPLDGDKLYCNRIDPITGIHCNGQIDYDIGFNKLHCLSCGAEYTAKDLKKNIDHFNIISKGVNKNMEITLFRGNKEIYKTDTNMVEESAYITKPNRRHKVEYADRFEVTCKVVSVSKNNKNKVSPERIDESKELTRIKNRKDHETKVKNKIEQERNKIRDIEEKYGVPIVQSIQDNNTPQISFDLSDEQINEVTCIDIGNTDPFEENVLDDTNIIEVDNIEDPCENTVNTSLNSNTKFVSIDNPNINIAEYDNVSKFITDYKPDRIIGESKLQYPNNEIACKVSIIDKGV